MKKGLSSAIIFPVKQHESDMVLHFGCYILERTPIKWRMKRATRMAKDLKFILHKDQLKTYPQKSIDRYQVPEQLSHEFRLILFDTKEQN